MKKFINLIILTSVVSMLMIYLNEKEVLPFKRYSFGKIPDLKGLTLSEAEIVCRLKGLTLVQSKEVFSKKYMHGRIAEQDPLAFRRTKETVVSVMISNGNPSVYVPELLGLSYSEGKKMLDSLSLLESHEYKISDKGLDIILETQPLAGTELLPGATVQLVLSKGKHDVLVPDLINKNIYVIKKILKNERLVLGYIKKTNDPNKRTGVAVKQYPESGKKVEIGTNITVVINENK